MSKKKQLSTKLQSILQMHLTWKKLLTNGFQWILHHFVKKMPIKIHGTQRTTELHGITTSEHVNDSAQSWNILNFPVN